VIVWRIATENKKYLATDLSGTGAALSPGRWNSAGMPVLYTASTPSLAMLETMAHIDAYGLPQMKYLVSIEIPQTHWRKRLILTANHLPIGWDVIPHGVHTPFFGSDWLKRSLSLVLCVPSAITPEETVVLINPLHDDAKHLTAVKTRAIDYKTVLRNI
jgi:RES domain-containing protein